uniref:Ig-like domain-containing protein n=1 Tax=Neogobius melanostomus TaxID=47308 RepID=A0A8C6WRX2_9GOBI
QYANPLISIILEKTGGLLYRSPGPSATYPVYYIFIESSCLNLFINILLSLTGQTLVVPRLRGDDVVLPCLFRPPRDVSGQTLEWSRPDLDPRFAFVFVWRSSLELTMLRNPAFAGRATLFTDELKHGNISLKLTSVGVSDDGTYSGSFTCRVTQSSTNTSTQDTVTLTGESAPYRTL